MGRPLRGKRDTFTFRVSAPLRAKIEAEARETGLSCSEVIERHLDREMYMRKMFERALVGDRPIFIGE